MIATEWQVVSKFGNSDTALIEECKSEQYARDYAEIERREYPHAEVWIERREVAPWERVA